MSTHHICTLITVRTHVENVQFLPATNWSSSTSY